MRRTSFVHMVLGAVALAAAGGCGQPEQPTLCVFSGEELGTGAAEDFDCRLEPQEEAEEDRARCPAQKDGAEPVLADGDAYFLRHELPDDTAPIGTLKIRVETPCGGEDLEATHLDGRALLAGKAPKGAACALTITAVMANSELFCSVPASDAAACKDLDVICAEGPPGE